MGILTEYFCIHMPKQNGLQYLLHMLLPCYMPNIWWAYMEDVYIYMCHLQCKSHQPCDKKNCTHILQVWLKKNGCQIANIVHTPNQLHGQIKSTYLHTYMPTYNTLKYILHKVLTNMCQKKVCLPNWIYMPHCQIIWCSYMRKVCEYLSCKKSSASTI